MLSMNNAYALVVGIANYDHEHIENLPETVLQDARDVQELLVNPNCCGYLTENVTLLLDKQATKNALETALANLVVLSNENSTVFIYVSSHGKRIETGLYAGNYLLPVEANTEYDKSLSDSALSGEALTLALRAIPARKVVVVFDCCHSGGIGQPKGDSPVFKDGLSDSYYQMLAQGEGRVILASSGSEEKSYVLPGHRNSVFTQHLLNGLKGEAVHSGGVVRILDLFIYVQPRVVKSESRQCPVLKLEIKDNFPIALHLGGKSPSPISSSPASLSDGYKHDVFISFASKSSEDRTWVHKILLPYLESKGLRVYLEDRFPLAKPIITSMEQAVQQSRYTVAVLSPDYIENGFSAFENLISQHLGFEQSKDRLITLMRKNCTSRIGLSYLYMLNMTEEDEFEIGASRLVDQIRQEV